MTFNYLQTHRDNFVLSNVHFLCQAKECPCVSQHDTSTGYLEMKCFVNVNLPKFTSYYFLPQKPMPIVWLPFATKTRVVRLTAPTMFATLHVKFVLCDILLANNCVPAGNRLSTKRLWVCH